MVFSLQNNKKIKPEKKHQNISKFSKYIYHIQNYVYLNTVHLYKGVNFDTTSNEQLVNRSH